MKPKTARLVWGIVLAAVGLLGLPGSAQTENTASYVVTCIALMIVGGLLVYFYARAMNEYNSQVAQDEALRQKIQQENENRIQEARKAREQRQEEAARRRWEEENAMHTCPNCGAVVKGHFCDYCGSVF